MTDFASVTLTATTIFAVAAAAIECGQHLRWRRAARRAWSANADAKRRNDDLDEANQTLQGELAAVTRTAMTLRDQLFRLKLDPAKAAAPPEPRQKHPNDRPRDARGHFVKADATTA